jgi:hypothetical protein
MTPWIIICILLYHLVNVKLNVFAFSIEKYKKKALEIANSIKGEESLDFKFLLFSQFMRILFSNIIISWSYTSLRIFPFRIKSFVNQILFYSKSLIQSKLTIDNFICCRFIFSTSTFSSTYIIFMIIKRCHRIGQLLMKLLMGLSLFLPFWNFSKLPTFYQFHTNRSFSNNLSLHPYLVCTHLCQKESFSGNHCKIGMWAHIELSIFCWFIHGL